MNYTVRRTSIRGVPVNSQGNKKFTERELDIMQILWKLGRGSLTDVDFALLKRNLLLTYTTVQTVMNRVEKKGRLKRDKSDRTHRYLLVGKEPNLINEAIQRMATRFFDGSAEAMAANFVERLTPKQLERTEARIAELRRKGHE